MAAAHEDLQRLAAQAAQALALRPILELASGFGLGLLALIARMAGRQAEPEAELNFLLLVVLPLAHCGLMLAYVALLRRTLSAHFRTVLAPPAAITPLLSGSEQQQRSFRQGLRHTLHGWRSYLRSSRQAELPNQPLIRFGGPALAALYATVALAVQAQLEWHPLFAPLLFVLLVLHFHGLKLAVAGDLFALSLLERLSDSAGPKHEP